jgi:CHAT domain-containing protein
MTKQGLSTTRNKSNRTAIPPKSPKRQIRTVQQELLKKARAAYRRGEFATARRLLLQVIKLGGPLNVAATSMLAVLDRREGIGAAEPKKYGGARRAKSRSMKKASRKRGGSRPPVRWEHIVEEAASPRAPLPTRDDFRERAGTIGEPIGRERPPLLSSGPEPTVVKRTPHLVLSVGDQPLRPGDEFTVDVFADRTESDAGEESEPVVVVGAPGQRKFNIEVWLVGTPQFDVSQPRARELTLDADADSSGHATFTVRVKPDLVDVADASIFAYFFYNGRPCGRVGRRVALRIELGSPAAAPPAPPILKGRLEPVVNAPAPDLTVEITDPTLNRRLLHCKVSTPLLPKSEQPEPHEWPLPSESGELVAGFMEQFIQGHSILSLKGAGQQLFAAAPESFKKTLWTLIDRGTPPQSILIVSQEPFIPWELMIPHRRRPDGTPEQRPPIGVEFAVGRWVSDDYLSPSIRVRLADSYVLAPRYPGPKPKPLANAANEAQLVLGAFPGTRIDPVDIQTLDRTFATAGRSLVHFVCHGADSPRSGIQSIFLDGGIERLTSIEIGQITGVIAGFRAKPLVFLNACEVGRPSISLVGIGGFARAFIDLGAAAVIAPLWSVADTVAFDVAERFYREVQAVAEGRSSRKSFANILRDIRALAYDPAFGKDTYAAYCFYGDPLAMPA